MERQRHPFTSHHNSSSHRNSLERYAGGQQGCNHHRTSHTIQPHQKSNHTKQKQAQPPHAVLMEEQGVIFFGFSLFLLFLR